jgi:WD40 repeat protein
LNIVDPLDPSLKLLQSYANVQDSPILDVVVLNNKLLLVAAMSGKLVLYNTETETTIEERKDHSKYIVKISSLSDGDSILIATAGWDSKIQLYKLSVDSEKPRLGEPIATLTLQTIPETVLFAEGPEPSSPVLLVARRDSTFLYYYDVPSPTARVSEFTLRGRQNLAPHSNAWVAFSPSDVQLCPTAPSIAAVATSSTPHMKLLVVRLLVPPARIVSSSVRGTQSEPISNSEGCVPHLGESAAPETQASQARAELLIQDRDEAAIILNVNTMAEQTAYSTPRLTWRPDGSGIYVSSDDGIVRGFEASTGKLMAKLDAHDPGSKIRCLWAGSLQTGSSELYDPDRHKEFLVTGGFDQKLILWTTA